MPDTNYWRADHPTGACMTAAPVDPHVPIRTLLPEHYESRYAYPLLVVFHGHGSNEDQVLRLAPRLSAQNFVFIGLRGLVGLQPKADGKLSCGWNHPEASELLPEYVRLAVELTRRTYHVHSERIYLAGVNEGCAAAFQAAFALAGKVAGVVALNGAMPRPTPGTPLFRMQDARKLRVFMGHGAANMNHTRAQAIRDYRLLYTAGADVHFHSYPTANKIHSDMLKDVNRWIIGNVNAEYESYQLK